MVVLAVSVWRLITGFSTFQYHQPDSLDLVGDKNTKNIFRSWGLRLTVTRPGTAKMIKWISVRKRVLYFIDKVWRSDLVINYWHWDGAREGEASRRRRFPGLIPPPGLVISDQTDWLWWFSSDQKSPGWPSIPPLTSGGLGPRSPESGQAGVSSENK